MVLAASQSSQARDESLLGKLAFQELFAKSTVQFFSFKVTLLGRNNLGERRLFFWFGFFFY